jgi:aerobic carbon-monoxide dehydrogenase large subunit
VSYVGASVPGLLNSRLAAGKGTFVGDIQLPGMTYAAILRSPHAHARIRSIDTRAAEKLPGVVGVVTGREVKEHMNPISTAWDAKEIGAKTVEWYALVADRARFVGEAVAAVVAEDKHTAYQALELIEVDYEVLPAVTDPEEALKPGGPLVEPQWGDNLLITRDFRVGDPESAFAEADETVKGVVECNRVTGTALEPRGCVGAYDPYTDKLTFWDSTQSPHCVRVYLAETLRISENSIHVIQPHVGGGFGLKQPIFQEEPLVAYLARKLCRPVKWIEERSENFLTGGHARDTRFQYEAAFMRDGTVTGIRLRVVADVGAPCAMCGWGMSFVTWYCLPTVYRIKNVSMQLFSVVTNKCPWNSYRGYGKDAATFLMERIMDHVARAAKQDPVAVRFTNFIPPAEFPYPQASGAILDSGDYPTVFRQLLDRIDYDRFKELQEAERRKGRYLGIGLSMELTPEGASMPGSVMICGYDGTSVRVSPNGEVTVLTGITSPGSGNETAIAQIAADELGCSIGRVKVIQGDSESCPWGNGNFSSRSIILGGSATQLAAADLRRKMLSVAASMLQVRAEDLRAENDRFLVVDSDRSVGFAEVASQTYRHTHGRHMDDIEPALEATRFFKIENVYHQPERQGRFSSYPTWPYGATACVVEVDPDTGVVQILRVCFVHDAGKIVNPLLASANLHGALAQGIGGSMYEEIAYDEIGQLRTATFMDYTIPTAVELPQFEIGHHETPSPFTPLGTKGVGESGIGGTMSALSSAIEDALHPLDVWFSRLPLRPDRVWEQVQAARAKVGRT